MDKLPKSRNGRIAVGIGGLVVLALVCNMCSSLTGGSKPTPTPVPPTVRPATQTPEVVATKTKRPTPTERPTEEATETTAPPSPTAAPTKPPVPPTAAATALPDKFTQLNPDEDRDCDEFRNQAEAQAYWNVYRTAERQNPGRLDGNGNGVVCEDTDRSSSQRSIQVPVQPPAPSRPCDTSLTCDDFGSWQEMFDWWNACGRPDKYDRNGDGDPCEGLHG